VKLFNWKAKPLSIRALIFDLGNVLVFFDHRIVLERLVKICNFSADEIRIAFFKSDIMQRYMTGRISSEHFFSEVQEKLNLRCNLHEFGLIFSDIFTPNQPVIDLVHQLSEKYPLFLLSDTNEFHFEFVQKNYPVLQVFRYHTLSYRVGSSKPGAEIFNHAIKQTGFAPHELIFIDDLKTNAEGAQAVGIQGIWFRDDLQLKRDLKRLGIEC
jgi:putative hydrolase of the HAD superfamily